MDNRPFFEKIFGKSWQTSIAGYGGGVMGIVMVVLGRALAVPDLVVAGMSLIGIAVMLVGQLARSNAASEAAHKEDAKQVKQDIREAKQDVKAEVVAQVKQVVVKEVKAAVKPE